jgi:ATP-binding cassette, subfamily B, bacterial PglK
MVINSKIISPEIKACLKAIKKSRRKKLFAVAFIQSCINLLDLIGVALIGLLAALTVNGIRSFKPGVRVSRILDFLGISDFDFQTQVATIAAAATFFLIIRTLLSVLVTRRTLYFLARNSAELSSELFQKILSVPLLATKLFTKQHLNYTITTGSNAVILGVVGSLMGIASDLSLVVILCVGLFVVDPAVSLFSFVFFGLVISILHFALAKRTLRVAEDYTRISIMSSERILEILNNFREIFVRNKRGHYHTEISGLRYKLSFLDAEKSWMPNISKYAVEVTLTSGTLLIAFIQFLSHDAVQAIGNLTIFMASGARLAPALLRIQQNLMLVNSNVVAARPTLNLIESTSSYLTLLDEELSSGDTPNSVFVPEVYVEKLSFTYPDAEYPAIQIDSMSIQAGEFVAIVGPSGGGKSTLADLILGVLPPSAGLIRISGLAPEDCFRKWPGEVGYVPQSVSINNLSIRENIALGFFDIEIDNAAIQRAASTAQLSEFLASQTSGLDTVVGENGSKISGGQRQRIGIARALYTNPKLLILDEATSSLDGTVEFDIANSISNLQGTKTVIAIAHRLSTVRKADKVIYIDGGKIQAQGTFDEIRLKVPDFDHQAAIMGL